MRGEEFTHGGIWYHAEENELGVFSVIGANATEILGLFFANGTTTLADISNLKFSGWVWIGDL